MRARDTDAEAHRAQLAVYAQMTPSERVALAFEFFDRARRVALAGIRMRSPKLSEGEARHVPLRRILGAELHRAAYFPHASTLEP